ncbi:DUF58 domain-containing protein [Bordetella hinzii]|uniref:DUF58 domain-containing protein n=1 Tax=Bordetella hinzii TaxID=103855 RepID=UPI001F106489|nr:DUF58 domain-containing protein [Bordetella hinzii]
MPSPVHVPLSELMALEGAVRGLNFAAHQPLRSVLAGAHGSRLRGRGLDFAELRRYVQGDDLRQLDARASLRLGKPFVRVYTEERDRPLILLVDQRMNMYFGSTRAFKSAVAARLAALSAWASLRAGDRVGGIVIGDEALVQWRPLRSRARVQALLAAVARENQSLSAKRPDVPAGSRLNEALRAARAMAPDDCLVAVISDFAGADEQTLRHLRLLRAHNDVIGMLVFDPMAQNLPQGGHVVISQGEVQLELAMGSDRLHRPLADFFSERLRNVATLLRQAQVPMLSIDTVEDARVQLRRELGLRGGQA